MRSCFTLLCLLAIIVCSQSEPNLRTKNVEKLLETEESSLWGRVLQDGGSMSIVIGDDDDDDEIDNREDMDGKKGKKGDKGAKKGKKGDGKKSKGKKDTEEMI
mmetsp:Transcript_24820/g.36729  ORF Transcript_24820/g.36729 Transcript_24820/m.36729 type:complete len:103 (+) Transcript_24820:71-379(+)